MTPHSTVRESPDPPAFGLIDLLATTVSAVFAVGTLLVASPWTLRLSCLAGGVVGLLLAWGATRRRPWDQKLLGLPAGTVLGLLGGAAAWMGLAG